MICDNVLRLTRIQIEVGINCKGQLLAVSLRANAGSWDEAVVQEGDSEGPVSKEAAVHAATGRIRGTSNSGRLLAGSN
jgi:hypothetical protein